MCWIQVQRNFILNSSILVIVLSIVINNNKNVVNCASDATLDSSLSAIVNSNNANNNRDYNNNNNNNNMNSANNNNNNNNKPNVISCEQARLKCAYRTGCGGALNNYIEACSQVMQGVVNYCPETCQLALVALTSTDEGKHLMNCSCSDDFCEDTKNRVEVVCRAQVLNTIRNETVPCRVAHWICTADPQCSTALEYYNRYCKSMFHGKKCTSRCLNSISILRRQEKAAKLNTCQCDGLEPYNCHQIQVNMARLCFHREHHSNTPPTDSNNSESNDLHPMLGTDSRSSNTKSSASKVVLFNTIIKVISILYLIKLFVSTVT